MDAVIKDYINNLPVEKQATIIQLLEIIDTNIGEGFELSLQYKMPAFVVPLSIYPKGYHCKKNEPLPFINIAAQKNYFSIHHMGLYNNELENWFRSEYSKISEKKLDLGKCCIRFKKHEDIPFELIGQLAQKLSYKDWINYYENRFITK
jgi:hypothetical protein